MGSAVSLGIDCGSAACKGALVIGGEVIATELKPTGWNPRETANEIITAMEKSQGIQREKTHIVATGYGRMVIDAAAEAVTEITCHALGAEALLPGVRTVIDIGGQDSKVIEVNKGKVMSFQMNDKCAAGTGRFLEMSAARMGVDLPAFAKLLDQGKSCDLSSMCAVFADSEIVSLLAAGKSREEIAGGVIDAIVARVMALSARVSVKEPVLLTGGLADIEGLRAAVARKLAMTVAVSPYSRFAGAIGAAYRCAIKKDTIH